MIWMTNFNTKILEESADYCQTAERIIILYSQCDFPKLRLIAVDIFSSFLSLFEGFVLNIVHVWEYEMLGAGEGGCRPWWSDSKSVVKSREGVVQQTPPSNTHCTSVITARQNVSLHNCSSRRFQCLKQSWVVLTETTGLKPPKEQRWRRAAVGHWCEGKHPAQLVRQRGSEEELLLGAEGEVNSFRKTHEMVSDHVLHVEKLCLECLIAVIRKSPSVE